MPLEQDFHQESVPQFTPVAVESYPSAVFVRELRIDSTPEMTRNVMHREVRNGVNSFRSFRTFRSPDHVYPDDRRLGWQTPASEGGS